MSIQPNDLPAVVAARQTENLVLDNYENRIMTWREWRDQIATIDRIQRGDWTIEKPDGSKLTRKPLVENLLNSAIEETGRTAGEQVPSVRVEGSSEASKTRAAEREQALLYGWQLSNVGALLPAFYMHLAATGLAAIKVMPDFRMPMETRFPKFSLIDPRGILPPPGWQFGQEPEDVIVNRMVPLRSLKKTYPLQAMQLMVAAGEQMADTTHVTVIDYYTADRLICIARINSGNKGSVVLYDKPNSIGMVPVVLGARPSADGKIRGQFDHLIAPMLTENRLMDYIAEYADQTVYSPVVKNFQSDITFGPGAIITTPEGGTVGRVSPAQMNPQVFAVQQQLEKAARRAGIIPEARAGDISQNIASANFVESILGSFLTNIHTLQKVGEVVLQRANEVYLAQDRTYCNAKKSIVGYANGGQFKTSYLPEETIKDGEFGNIVSYGASAGLDSLNASVRVLQWQGAGLVPKRWARENLDIKNFLDVERQIENEFVLEAVKGLTLAQAQQLGNGEPLRKYLEAVMKNGNPLDAIDAILAATQPVPTTTPDQGNQAAAALQNAPANAQGLQRGAVPAGGSEAANPLPNPPLTQIMVRNR